MGTGWFDWIPWRGHGEEGEEETSTTFSVANRCERCGALASSRRVITPVKVTVDLLGKQIAYRNLCLRCQRAVLGFRWEINPTPTPEPEDNGE